ncbi:MAG: hypothetical protein ABEI98_05125 [Halorhabdus sp.]
MRKTSKYDVYLTAIPLLFVAAFLTGRLGVVSTEGGLFGASMLGAAMIADGLFLDPPAGGTSQ